ncbi:MAG: sigma 54-interacting transcriptional regulator [Planctomycetota bacterium]
MTSGLQTRTVGEVALPQGTFRVLVCAGDPGVERELNSALAPRGGTVTVVTSSEAFAAATGRETFDVAFVDLPVRRDGHSEWRENVAQRGVEGTALVIAVTADRENEALALLGRTVIAYITKPCTVAQAAAALDLAAENRRLRRRVQALEAQMQDEEAEDELVGCSPAIRRLSSTLSRAGANDATVLIEGKPGVGKTLVARLIHKNGRRAKESLEIVNCELVDEPMLEAALERAKDGTLLLEDVDRLAARCQSRLVRHLKESGNGQRAVRIIATTSARLAELTAKGVFREDLYYRLNMFPISVPTLAERREDLPMLASHFLRMSSTRSGLPDRGFTPAAMIMIEAHPWPGNVSQLKNAIQRAHALADGQPVDRVHLFGTSTGVQPPPGVQGLTDRMDERDDDEPGEDEILPFQDEEKRLLNRALRATRGNVRRAAQLLGIGRATLYRKIQIYQLRMN